MPAPSRSPRRPRSSQRSNGSAPWATRGARALLLAISTALTLLALEVGLRAFWDGYYLKGNHAYAQPHATRGWSNVPGAVIDYGEPEFRIRVTHNALGFRGPEVEPPGPTRQRVLLLGDSFAYGIGAEDDETLSAQLEQRAPSLQVLNAGVNGYGTGQELLLLLEEGPALDPDIVVLAFFWNDVANNVERDRHRFALVDGEIVPPARIETLPGVAASPTSSRRPILHHSYLYRFTSDRLKTARFWAKDILGIPHEDGDRLAPDRREAAWELEKALLREMRAAADRLGAAFLVAIIPEQVQVQPDAHVLGLVEADYAVQDRLRVFGEEEGIAILDLLPPMRSAYAESGQPLYYRQDRHLRPAGIEIAADQILTELRSRGWLAKNY